MTLWFKFFISIGLSLTIGYAQFADDVFDKYTTVGQLGMTVTNFGVLGNGWNKINGEILPSCQYKQHTEVLREQVEYFSYAGLWIGGIVNGQRRVSTAIVDGVFEAGDEGFEFFASSGLEIKSSISSTSEDPMAQYYDPSAVSHQDFITDFKDYGSSSNDDNEITNHNPLGIDIHLESYAWNFSYADAFVLLKYTITNKSQDNIEDIYAGFWADASVANFNYTDYYTPGGGFSWYDNLDGFDTTVDEAGFTRDIAYQYDADGDDGWAESYIGFTFIGSSVPRPYSQAHYSQWIWNTSSNSDYPAFTMPENDYSRYGKLMSSVPPGNGEDYTSDGYPNQANSWLFLLSAGPLGSSPANADSVSWILPPDSSCTVVFAVVAAHWSEGSSNSPGRRASLHVNKDWAQRAYDGEDKNRNNILDDGEDIDEDGEITRYILPEPPPVPNMAVDVEDQKVTVYWSNNAEYFVDPVSREQDFEGYHIYGARKTISEEFIEFSLLGEFDVKPYVGDEFIDTNGNGNFDVWSCANGIWDEGEIWTDSNGNGVWDWIDSDGNGICDSDFVECEVWIDKATSVCSEEWYDLNGNCVYDSPRPDIGYNTGIGLVRITDEYGCASEIEYPEGSRNYYQYKFVNDGVKNGWLNYYAVTAYDRGDPETNMESLESSVYANRKYVFPGVVPEETRWTVEPSVYPNPYRGQAAWDGYGSRGRMIWFQNLPSKAEIRIFTLAGDLVDIIQHDENYAGGDIQNIDEGKSPIMSGGEHAWDLVTQHDQAIASGLYLFSVENKNSESSSYGTLKEGKFLIIK